MYALVNTVLGVPSTGANTTVTYVAGVLLILFTAIVIDMVYKIIRSVTKTIEKI